MLSTSSSPSPNERRRADGISRPRRFRWHRRCHGVRRVSRRRFSNSKTEDDGQDTNFLSHEQLSQKVLLWEKILRFFRFHFHLRLRQNSFPLSFLFFFPLLCSVILKI